MKIERKEISIRSLVDGYSDDGEGGVVGYGGLLDIRPAYQREFVYKDKQRDDVIRSVLAGFPLNMMYWARQPAPNDKRFEVLDGQQRTISIAQYVAGHFSLDGRYFTNQPPDVQARIGDYELTVYVCDGEASEKLDWFKILNIAGEKLELQELRNAVYTGPWLSDAKRHFSKQGCAGQGKSAAYIKANPVRQQLLQIALQWVSEGDIEDYMGKYQHEPDASHLWAHFKNICAWIKRVFPNERPIMRGVGSNKWAQLYRAHHHRTDLDPEALEAEIHRLLTLGAKGHDHPIQNKSGVYAYVLDRNEQHLNLRTFDREQKTTAYERQNGQCAVCQQAFDFDAMEGDHIIPWYQGGLTTDDNLQMLCVPCNRHKGAR